MPSPVVVGALKDSLAPKCTPVTSDDGKVTVPGDCVDQRPELLLVSEYPTQYPQVSNHAPRVRRSNCLRNFSVFITTLPLSSYAPLGDCPVAVIVIWLALCPVCYTVAVLLAKRGVVTWPWDRNETAVRSSSGAELPPSGPVVNTMSSPLLEDQEVF